MDIRSLIELKRNPGVVDFRPGDTVRVQARVVEGERERVQAFEGVVIRVRGGGINSNFTVRRISHGVGVERTFPFYSPLLEKVELLRAGQVRRAKLYYLRERRGKAARIKAGRRRRQEWGAGVAVQPAAEEAAPAEDIEAEEAEPAADAKVTEAEGEESGAEQAELVAAAEVTEAEGAEPVVEGAVGEGSEEGEAAKEPQASAEAEEERATPADEQ